MVNNLAIDWSKSKSDSLASQELCYTISKHPDREYALAGSPPHVVLGSFIQFCNKIVLKTCKFGLGTDGLEPEIRASSRFVHVSANLQVFHIYRVLKKASCACGFSSCRPTGPSFCS